MEKFADVPRQYQFFYDLKWDREMDGMLLRRVLDMEAECLPIPTYKSMHALTTAMIAINGKFEKSLCLQEVVTRMEHLERRYKTFKELTRMKEMHWDLQTNELVASEEVWETIFKGNFFAKAYLREGEPHYYVMCLLFGKHDIRQENSRTVILISDSPNPTINNTLHIISSSPDDDVSSYVMPTPPKSARKLLIDDAMSCVGALPTPHVATNVPRHKGKARNTPQRDESSCASSNPVN